MFRFVLGALALCTLVPLAQAGECEDRFQKVGRNMLTRVDYSSHVMVPDVSVADAFGQLRSILIASKMVVVSDDPASGAMLAEQPASNASRAVPVLVNATEQGGSTRIDLTLKTQRGQSVDQDQVKAEICRILGLVKGGKAGKAAAVAGRRQQNPDPTTFRDVYVFSREIAAEAEANAVAVNARHRGRKYALKGKVDYIMEDGNEINVGFRIPRESEVLLSNPNAAPRVAVACLFRQDQMASVLTFRKGDMTTFRGNFFRYDDFKRVVWLENCVQAR